MTIDEKCVKNLETMDIVASEDNGVVYVHVQGTMLQLSESEIQFQADECDKRMLGEE